MRTAELVSILMESPYYFDLAPTERLHLWRYLRRLYGRARLEAGEFRPAPPGFARIHLGFFPPLQPAPTFPTDAALLSASP
jgi:hypothetical protein